MNNPVASLSRQVNEMHQRFDVRLPDILAEASSQGARIHCSSRCSTCCSLAVFTSLPEAALIAASLTADQTRALESYISRLRSRMTADCDLRSFLKLCRTTLGLCPFIDADNCSIYSLRPLACRALLSTRPADWCGVDFSTLHPLEQQAFLSSLDQQLVDYPSHYLASSKRRGQSYELQLLDQLRRQYGFALSGHLPTLVWLEIRLQLSQNLWRGANWIRENLSGMGLSPAGLLLFDHD